MALDEEIESNGFTRWLSYRSFSVFPKRCINRSLKIMMSSESACYIYVQQDTAGVDPISVWAAGWVPSYDTFVVWLYPWLPWSSSVSTGLHFSPLTVAYRLAFRFPHHPSLTEQSTSRCGCQQLFRALNEPFDALWLARNDDAGPLPEYGKWRSSLQVVVT